ncbi:MAG: glycosyltransferase family 9 protein [Spirochaetes bacterium]|nr:glycosyltransferase family 9 protein [Spirochaetota bacterium]
MLQRKRTNIILQMPKRKTDRKRGIRVLLIRFSSIGDIVLTTSLIHALKTDYPDMTLDYLTLPEYALLIRDNPFIDNLYYHDRNKGIVYAAANARLLNKNKYDYVFDLHRSTRSGIYRKLIRADKKTALVKNYIKRFLLIRLKINLYKKPYSVVERYFKTAGLLKSVPHDKSEIWIGPAEYNKTVSKINYLLKSGYSFTTADESFMLEKSQTAAGSKLVCMMPFARWKTKEWGDEKFAELAAKLISGKGCTVLILGGSEDTSRAESIAEKAGRQAVSIAGKTGLVEASVILSFSSCLVTNDTGLMHIGGAVSIPVTAIFGSTTEELGFFPYKTKGEVIQRELKCRPCTAKGLNNCPIKHFKCMSDISVDSVYSAVEKYI